MQNANYVSALDGSAGFVLGVAYRKMSNLFMQRLKKYGITSEQWVVLYAIQEKDGAIQKDIAERAGKDKPTVTRIMDALLAKGLIVKKADRSDRRSFLVFLTEKGKELIRHTEGIERKMVEEATSGISKADYDLLIRLLCRIGENIDRLPKE